MTNKKGVKRTPEQLRKERERDRAARRERSKDLLPIDVAILKGLPRKGSILGVQVIGATVAALAPSLNQGVPREGWVTSDQVNARLRILRTLGYVTDVRVLPVSRGMGWQITPAGELALDEYRQKEAT